jgi:hypothetical protein
MGAQNSIDCMNPCSRKPLFSEAIAEAEKKNPNYTVISDPHHKVRRFFFKAFGIEIS